MVSQRLREILELQRCWAEIDLDAACSNLQAVRQHLKNPETRIMAVVKADAYGHGAKILAKAFVEQGADALAVANIDEALSLKALGIRVPILILSLSAKRRYSCIIESDFEQIISSYEEAEAFSKLCEERAQGEVAKIHLACDCGMRRIGLSLEPEDFEKSLCTARKILSLPHIKMSGIMTHFPVADTMSQDERTKTSLQRFVSFCDVLKSEGFDIGFRHAANSAALLRFPESQLDMVRPGIILYGLMPDSGESFSDDSRIYQKRRMPMNQDPDFFGFNKTFKSVMKFCAEVAHLKPVRSGMPVGYGATTRILPDQKYLATLSVGYADGYCRRFSNWGKVLLPKGVLVEVCGRICMDAMMVALTEEEQSKVQLKEGDSVTLFGGNEGAPSLSFLARQDDTIHYELCTRIAKRVPRVYMQSGDFLAIQYEEERLVLKL